MHARAMAAVVALAAVLSAPFHAAAQDDAALLRDGVFVRDRNVSVAERPKPKYAPNPVRVGWLVVDPALQTSLAYDDNILATDAKGSADALIAIRPSVSVTSDWPRNQVSGFARAAQSAYLAHPEENTTDYAAGLAGRLDGAQDLGFAGSVSVERDTEPRTSEASPVGALHPVQYDLTAGWIEATKAYERLRLTARASIQDYAYENAEAEDGGTIYQRDQDRTESGLAGLAEYVYSPELSWLASVAADRRQYRDAAAGEPSRSSTGYEASVGTSFDITRLARGDIRLGFLRQDYENSAFKGPRGLTLSGKVEYFPTTLTTVTVTAGRDVRDSGIPAVPGYTNTAAAVRIDHELLRNLVLTARLSEEEHRYLDYSRKDAIGAAQATASYLVNRLVSLTLDYTRLSRRSQGDSAGEAYAINRVTAGITCRF